MTTHLKLFIFYLLVRSGFIYEEYCCFHLQENAYMGLYDD